jgi:hypothetical protein
MEYVAAMNLVQYLVQLLYFTDKEIETQRNEMTFI